MHPDPFGIIFCVTTKYKCPSPKTMNLQFHVHFSLYNKDQAVSTSIFNS